MTAATIAPREILPADAPRDEWLAERKNGLGATDVTALFGVNPYATKLSVYLDKTMDRDDDSADGDEQDSDVRYWGTQLEPVVRDHFARRNAVIVKPTGLLAHPQNDWMRGTLDGFIYDGDEDEHSPLHVDGLGVPCSIYEGKTASAWLSQDWKGEKVPDHYVLQVQWYLAVTGLPKGYIAALIGGNHYVQARIDRDDELIDGMITVASRFWQQVLDRRPPGLEGEPVKAALDLLKALNPVTIDGKAVKLPPGAKAWRTEYWQAHADIKAAEDRKTAAQVRLLEALGDAERGTVDGDIVISASDIPAVPISYTRKAYRRLNIKKVSS